MFFSQVFFSQKPKPSDGTPLSTCISSFSRFSNVSCCSRQLGMLFDHYRNSSLEQFEGIPAAFEARGCFISGVHLRRLDQSRFVSCVGRGRIASNENETQTKITTHVCKTWSFCSRQHLSPPAPCAAVISPQGGSSILYLCMYNQNIPLSSISLAPEW